MGSFERSTEESNIKSPHTALAVAIDLGEWNDIHPLNKKDLAKRIALLAKKMVYGHKKHCLQWTNLLIYVCGRYKSNLIFQNWHE